MSMPTATKCNEMIKQKLKMLDHLEPKTPDQLIELSLMHDWCINYIEAYEHQRKNGELSPEPTESGQVNSA